MVAAVAVAAAEAAKAPLIAGLLQTPPKQPGGVCGLNAEASAASSDPHALETATRSWKCSSGAG